jgi:dCTP deaminase
MVLSKPDILAYLEDGRLRIDPTVEPSQIAQVSIDLRLGRKFTTFKDPPKYIPAIQMDPSVWESFDLWEHHEIDTFCLEPDQIVLARTLEEIYIPNDLVGFVEGRSSWARLGISIHITAPKIDPGFNAPITLEMVNFGRMSVNLRAEIDKPAQLILMKITTPLSDEDLYGSKEEDIFQHQTSPIPHQEK